MAHRQRSGRMSSGDRNGGEKFERAELVTLPVDALRQAGRLDRSRSLERRGVVFAVALTACAVDSRATDTARSEPQSQVADLGACEPGALPSSCDDGLQRVCTQDGRWVLIACEPLPPGSPGGSGGAPGTAGA